MSDTEVIKEIAATAIDFDELVLENHQSVRLFLARYIHCPQHVDDLAQETFVTAFKQLSRFRGQSKPSTWLIGIARNKALQFMRMEQRRRNKVLRFADMMLGYEQLQHGSCESLENEYLNRMDALEHCLDQLPPHSLSLVEQFYFGRVSAVAIAVQTGAKESAVRMKLKRIRNVLQKCIRTKLENN